MNPRFRSLCTILAALSVGMAQAQLAGEGLPDLSGISGAVVKAASLDKAAKPAAGTAFSSGLKVPSVSPGAAAKELGRQLREKIETAVGKPLPGMQQLEDGMPNALAQLEAELTKIGFAKRDFGVAVGFFFISAYETATGKTVPTAASEAAGRTVALAVGQTWASAYQKLPAAKKESVYETLLMSPMLLDAFATQFEKSGMAKEAKEMRGVAAAAFERLFGTAPSEVTIDANGRISGLKAVVSTPNLSTIPAPKPASTGGAKFFVRYKMRYGTGVEVRLEELALFPGGTAFDGLPGKPVPRFDVATLKQFSRPGDVGRWKMNGSQLELTFDGKTERFKKHGSGGWAEADYTKGSFDVYFPIKPLTKQQLLGAWKNESLTTMGSMGGGAPMVAAGSNSQWSFAANGTFDKNRKGFASATTANMGDGFKSGGDTTTYGKSASGSVGKWRLDGPLLTMVSNGESGVVLAYILPNWGKPGEAPEIHIGGDRWARPDSK